jgi:hypothetical protein
MSMAVPFAFIPVTKMSQFVDILRQQKLAA